LFTFTLPEPLRPVARSHQKLVYDALLRSAADAIITLTADPRQLGARPAILAVLHTHGRDLGYHPHAHLLVSAGGLQLDTEQWIAPKHTRFLLPARVLSVLFRQKMRDALDHIELADELPAAIWHKPWVVHAQHAGSGEQALHYLGLYLFKSPLPNSRLERFENSKVTFRFQSHRTANTVYQTLNAHVFLQRLLQHVLPERLHHVRGYGLLAPTSMPRLQCAHEILRGSLCVKDRKPSNPESPALAEATSHRCPSCQQGHMHLVERLTPAQACARLTMASAARAPP